MDPKTFDQGELLRKLLVQPDPTVIVTINPFDIDTPMSYTKNYLGEDSEHYGFTLAYSEQPDSPIVTIRLSFASWINPFDDYVTNEFAVFVDGKEYLMTRVTEDTLPTIRDCCQALIDLVEEHNGTRNP